MEAFDAASPPSKAIMEAHPSDEVDAARWRNALGYRSSATEDAPLSDVGGNQFFDYDRYEAADHGAQARDEGGEEMWYDAESQPFEQPGMHAFMQPDDREYARERQHVDYAESSQWRHEAAQFGDQLVGVYNDESWEQTPALERNGPSFNATSAGYGPTNLHDSNNTTYSGPPTSRPSGDYGILHGQEYDSATFEDTPIDHQQESSEADENDEDEDEDGDEKVLQAAYENYYADDLLRSGLVPALPANYLVQSADPAELTSLESLVNLDALNSTERWEIDRESAAFLNEVVVETNKDYMELLLQSAQTSLRESKIEEPVLLTDPQMDMMRIMARSKLELKADGLKPHKLNPDNEESLEWPAKYANLPELLSKKIDNERLTLDMETLEYLKDIHDGPDIDLDAWLDDERKRRAKPQYVSPKLLPLSPPYSPPQMPSSVANIPLLSTPGDPNEREVAELDKMLRDKDEAAMQQQDSAYSSFGINTDSSSSPMRRKMKRMSTLKVSDPILPAEDVEPPTKKQKTVTFQEELHTMIPPPTSSDIGTIDAVDEAFATVEKMLEPLAAPAIQQSENEALDEVDTTMRVAVPAVEPLTPTPPWQEGNDDTLGPRRSKRRPRPLAETIDNLAKTEKKWTGVSKLDTDLPWSAFACHLGKIRAEGDFDDGSAARYIAELDDGDVNLESLTYRPEKLQLLTVDEFEDDELEPLNLDDNNDDDQQQPDSEILPVPSAILTIQPPNAEHQDVPSPPAMKHKFVLAEPSGLEAVLRRRREELQHDRGHLTKPQRQFETPICVPSQMDKMQPAIFGGGLTQHMSMHGISGLPAEVASASIKHNKPQVPEPLHQRQPTEQTTVIAPAVSIPLPAVPRVDVSLPVVVSSTIMKTNQQLVRSLQKLLPTLEIIERDYGAAAPTGHKTTATGMEAAITVSPSTGLMFTNLQKLKQKPLPGQTSHFGIREQIAEVAPRYEHLIVFVSGSVGGTGEEVHVQPLDESDTSALTDLIGFGTTLDCEVEIVYTAGGNAELAHWTAATMSQHARGHSSFLPEETTWECFLRQAGMNTYAAQVLLDQLKPNVLPLHCDSSYSQSPLQYGASGLGAFVAMSAEERVYRFAEVLGGVRVLQRVCEVIDGPLIPVQQL